MSNVVPLELVEVGENYRIDGDQILEEAKGQKWHRMMVIGQLEGGEIYIAGSANAGESLILMEMAKHDIVFGD